jgi:sigma-B regulation protein RsbU (phosphoserine phosphatase)
MKMVDLTQNPRIAVYLDMVTQLARTRDLGTLLEVYKNAIEQTDGHRPYAHLGTAKLPPGHYRVLRAVDGARMERVARSDLDIDQAAAEVHTTGLLSELVRTPAPKLIIGLDCPDDPVLGDYFVGMRSLMLAPMFFRGNPGDWLVVCHPEPEAFTELDLERSMIGANMLASYINNLMLNRELVEAQAYIEQEVRQIEEIQRSLLPSELPAIPGVSLCAHYETFDRAGGDYYSFLPLNLRGEPVKPDTPWAIIIADASGHGPSAAVVTAMLHSLLHSYDKGATRPRDFIEHINANLQSERLRHSFVTAFFGVYHPHERLLRYVRAGHDPPLLMQPGNPAQMRRLDQVNGFPLGVASKVGSDEAVVALEPGQSLVFYTDGITDSFSPMGERFTVEGIEKALHHCDGSPGCVVAYVRAALLQHEAGRRAQDDQTIVAMRVEGE